MVIQLNPKDHALIQTKLEFGWFGRLRYWFHTGNSPLKATEAELMDHWCSYPDEDHSDSKRFGDHFVMRPNT